MVRKGWLVVALLLLAAPPLLSAKDRTWTDSNGRTMRADFVREVDGDVTFIKDGKIVTLALDRLSERDQQVVRDLMAGKPVADDPIPAPQPESPPAVSAPVEERARPSAPAETVRPSPEAEKPVAIENRAWTDIHGNQMTAKYVRIFGSNVVLLRGVRSVTVKFYELSSEDQEYLRELLTSRGQEGVIPPKVESLGGLGGDAKNGGDTASPAAADPANFEADQGAALRLAEVHSQAPPGSAPMPRGGGAFPGSGTPGGPGFAPMPGGGPSFPGGGGFGPPAGGSSAPMPGASPYSPPGFGGPGSQPDYGPVGPSGMPAPGSSPASGSFDRLNQDLQRHTDSMQQMQDRLNQQHESFRNRHRSVAECLNCKRSLTEAESSRSSCPHCGVTWDYEIDEYGNKRDLNNSSFSNPFAGATNSGNAQPMDARTARTIGLVVGIFIGLAVIVGMIIGVIYVVMSIASASSSSQQRQYR